ncbi:related to integral membrane protein [Phialocephala subalpina]|uniref:Related to integral membrane protein n=1 Tax=Phialocephala subalpina TaxID=576137 RepID=A0A1L7WUB4_9HELO|nr:related to integral membrane protein [Phialocephala subalpina]
MASATSTQASVPTQQPHLKATNIVVIILAGLFVVLRFVARWKKRANIGLDDYFIVLAFALLAEECIYLTTIAIIKVSLLLMYVRIFPFRSMRIGCWILGSLSVSLAVAFTFVGIFQCNPIAKSWNPTIPGYCINLKASFIGNAVPNILTDVAILTLPINQIRHLHTNLMQRLQLSVVFLLGSFVVFTSIYRFKTLFEFDPTDLSWTLASACTWCVVECCAGIISACLPTLAPLLFLFSSNISNHCRKSATPPTLSSIIAPAGLVTIGGTGGNASGPRKSVYGRLSDELRPPHSNETTSRIYGPTQGRVGDQESWQSSGDEIPLRVIQKKVDIEWVEERNR